MSENWPDRDDLQRDGLDRDAPRRDVRRDSYRDAETLAWTARRDAAIEKMGETRARRRELVSICLALAGAVGVVVCLVHLGPWASGALVSALVLCAGAGGLVRRDERAEADTEGGEHRGE